MKIRDLQRGRNEAYYFNIIGIQEEKIRDQDWQGF